MKLESDPAPDCCFGGECPPTNPPRARVIHHHPGRMQMGSARPRGIEPRAGRPVRRRTGAPVEGAAERLSNGLVERLGERDRKRAPGCQGARPAADVRQS